jgi:hypothetical protein
MGNLTDAPKPHCQSFLCVQELAFLEPSVERGKICKNRCEEYCEHFQLIFLLTLTYMYPAYSFVVYTLHAFVICSR